MVQVAKDKRSRDQVSTIRSSVHRPFNICPDEAPPPKADPYETMGREPNKLRTATEKGALLHEYDFLVHQLSLTSAVFTLATRI